MNQSIKNVIDKYRNTIVIKTKQYFDPKTGAYYFDNGHKCIYSNKIYDLITRLYYSLPYTISNKPQKQLNKAKIYTDDVGDGYFLLSNGKLIHRGKTIYKFGRLPAEFIVKNGSIYHLHEDGIYKNGKLYMPANGRYCYCQGSLNSYFIICNAPYGEMQIIDENGKIFYRQHYYVVIHAFFKNYFCVNGEVYCLC